MDKFEIYGWEPSVSPHKLALFRALRDSGRVSKITYIAQSDLSDERRKQGWSRGEIDDLSVVINPSVAEIDSIVEEASADAIHIFSGVHWSPVLAAGLAAVQAKQRRFGLMREPRAYEGVKGLARLIHTWATEGVYRKRADFVLAIGRNGPPWFRWAGYAAAKIFPFAYFLPDPPPSTGRSEAEVPLVVYLGRLETEKGIQLLLGALSKLKTAARYVVAGSGSLQGAVEEHSSRAGSNLEFLGPLPMADAADLLASADIVCAPSISSNDGWCAVVSEALMAGAAVLTTAKVGASICIEQDARLGIIAPSSAAGVAKAVDDLLGRDILTNEMRNWRAIWSRQRLTAEAGADYLVKIFDHLYCREPRPLPFYI